MIKYLKYFTPTFFLILSIYMCSIGSYYPTIFFVGFSLLVILGDIMFSKDENIEKFTYPGILNFSLYLNLPFLFILVFCP